MFLICRQETALTGAMDALGTSKSEKDINLMMRQHTLEREVCEERWSKELNQLQESQRREYRDWVTTVHLDMETSRGKETSRLNNNFRLCVNSNTAEPEIFAMRKFSPFCHPFSFGKKNVICELFSCANDYIDNIMATFSVLMKINSTNCFCSTEVAGLGEIFQLYSIITMSLLLIWITFYECYIHPLTEGPTFVLRNTR